MKRRRELALSYFMAEDSVESLRQDFDKRQEVVQVSRGTKKRGELAELAFVYKAASLGFGVARPYGDSDRFDFIVLAGEHFWKVQVKSSSAMQYGAYLVNAERNANGRAIPYTPDEINFLVAHIVPEDAWLVIPVQAFTPRRSIRVYPKGDGRVGRYEKYREAWWLME